MTPSAPTRPYERLLTSSLAITCVALATAIALVSSLVVHRAAGGGAMAKPPASVSVFADAAAPSSTSTVGTGADAALAVTTASPWRPAGAAPSAALASADDDAGAPGPVTVFPDGTSPQTPVDPDRRSVELGLRFVPKVAGTVSAIRFFATPHNRGPHTGTLWGPSGEVLARVTFPDAAEATGWQTAEISPAVPVDAGRTYVASYVSPAGGYAADEDYFVSGVETATLRIPAGAGVYAYGSGRYPTDNYRNSNYYVDVAFQPAPAPQPTPEPTPPATPLPTASPTATPEPTPEPTPTPTTSPSPAPQPGAGGVFGETTAPDRRVDPDRESVELGMRFVPKVDGEVTAIRFYRSAVNTGPHTGSLWAADGTRLARVDFGPDEPEGWQTAALSTPVAVEAGRLYVVSYLASAGLYSADEHYFDVGIENDYFSVPAGAGVYAYGRGAYPSENYRNSNYYVDVRFSPADAVTPSPSPSATPQRTASATPTPRPTASATPRPTPSPSPTPTPTPTPTPSAPGEPTPLDLPTEAWWGGSSYYAQWEKAARAGWDDPSFFPIAVFFGKPSHADELAAVGVNTYMGAEHDGSRMSTITREGISVLAQSEWTPAEVGDDPRVVGWHVSDECEMGYSNCAPNGTEYDRLEAQKRFAAQLRAHDDGRFLQANFGNGVLGTFWAPNTMDDHLALIDVSSVDKYAYTSPHVQGLFRDTPAWPSGVNPATAAAYGWQQDRMEQFMSPAGSKPNWVFVETAMPYLTEGGASTISGDQIEGAVWNGIIHGAAGIAYFQHNNNGRCGTYSLVECGAALRSKVAQVNADVTSMAPVLNSPSYVWEFGAGLDTSLKAYAGAAYIFAMPEGAPGERVFTLPPAVRGSTVEVVGENRTLPVTDGTFRDAFSAEHQHHIYRVQLAG